MSFLNSLNPNDLYTPYNPDDNLSAEECQEIIKNIHLHKSNITNYKNTNNLNNSNIPRTPIQPIITEAPNGYNTLIPVNNSNIPRTPIPPIITEAPNGYNTLIPVNNSNIPRTPIQPIITEAPNGYNTLLQVNNNSITDKNNDNMTETNITNLDNINYIPTNNDLSKYKYYICPFIGFNLSNNIYCQFTLGACTQYSKAWMNPFRSIKRLFKCFPEDKANKIGCCDECKCCVCPCICCVETCITCFILLCVFELENTN